MIPHAKEGQDLLALHLVGNYGFFLDIGMGDPCDGNNSLVLEQRGWDGVMFDAQAHCVAEATKTRVNEAIHCDVTTFDFKTYLDSISAPKVIDFISMDVDNANTALVKAFPFHAYEFKVMAFETDRYNGGDTRKLACEAALAPYPQYVYLFENVKVQGLEFESWIINTKYLGHLVSQYEKSIDWEDGLRKLGAL